MVNVQMSDTGGTVSAGRARCRAAAAPSPDDDALVARVLAGDPAAFAGIVERHRLPVRRLAYRMLADADEADDAAQEAFVRAYVNLAKYRPGSSLRTWLLAITGNWCRDQLRGRHVARRRMVSLATLAAGARTDDNPPEARVLSNESKAAIRRVVATLPEQYRQVLVLRYDRGLSYREIGQALARPISTVRMRLFRARGAVARGYSPGVPSPVPATGPCRMCPSPDDAPDATRPQQRRGYHP